MQNKRRTEKRMPDRQTERKTERERDRQTKKIDRQTDSQTDCQIDRQYRLLVCPPGHRWLNTFSLYFVGSPERQSSRFVELVRVACSPPTHFHFLRLLLKSHKNVINLRVIVQSSRQARRSFFWLNWIIIYFNWQKANATPKQTRDETQSESEGKRGKQTVASKECRRCLAVPRPSLSPLSVPTWSK